MTVERKICIDCYLYLPLKQFASYRGTRHPLCRTCLAVDVHEFKAWVLPLTMERRSAIETPYHWEPWELAVCARTELSAKDKIALLCRTEGAIKRASWSKKLHAPGAETRPWKKQTQLTEA